MDVGYLKPGVSDASKWAPVFRGFPTDVEVLTEFGWVLFSHLFRAGVQGLPGRESEGPLFSGEVDWSVEHVPLVEDWYSRQSKHQKGYGFAQLKDVDFNKFSVSASFPRLVVLSADHVARKKVQHGGLVLLRPEFATRFMYPDYSLVHLKRRGVDLAVPRFTDVFTRAFKQSSWGFSVADEFCEVKKLENVYRMMVNRYSPAGVLHGDVSGGVLRDAVESGDVSALLLNKAPVKMFMGGKHASWKRIDDVYPYPEVRDSVSGQYMKNPVKRVEVECFNFVFPAGSSHTLIVRRAGKTVHGEQPHTEWVGFPVIAGDGYDKSQIPSDVVAGFYG